MRTCCAFIAMLSRILLSISMEVDDASRMLCSLKFDVLIKFENPRIGTEW